MGNLWVILARFDPKGAKPYQLRDAISQQRIEIFEFCKKHLNPHMQAIRVYERENNLKFWPRPPVSPETSILEYKQNLFFDFLIFALFPPFWWQKMTIQILGQNLPQMDTEICEKGQK